MKAKSVYLILVLILIVSACSDRIIEIYTANSPVYLSYEELRTSVKQSDARELVNPGKIYFKDNYIFIVDKMKGIHVINNQDPSNPDNMAYIEVPGNIDIAIKGNILYADSYIDLVAIDVSDIQNMTEVGRVEEVLPYTLPPFDEEYPLSRIDPDEGVVFDWEVKQVREEAEHYYYPVYRGIEGAWNKDMATGGTGGVSSGGVGIAGSMARFGISENTLYAVDESIMHIFSIRDQENPEHKKDFNAGWGIETMFILDDHMFLGSQSGMRIYDISVPNSPMYLSDFWHVTGCDPVVVQNDLAYITLRGGNRCGNEFNLLVVVSIKDLSEPRELKSYPMEGPYGLGIDGNVLFVCDGEAGLKVYNARDPMDIANNQIARFPDIVGFDVIPLGGILMLIGEDGLYQYDYSDVENILLLSKIEVGG